MQTYIVTNEKRKTWKVRVKAENSFEAREQVARDTGSDILDWYAIKADAKL